MAQGVSAVSPLGNGKQVTMNVTGWYLHRCYPLSLALLAADQIFRHPLPAGTSIALHAQVHAKP